jgi:hypothetical protein
LLTRSGNDIEKHCEKKLKELDIDLEGWMKYPDIPTPHGVMEYNEEEYMKAHSDLGVNLETLTKNLQKILAKPINLPQGYRQPKVIHLITEFSTEPMVQSALELKKMGTIFSLEPIVDYQKWSNKNAILDLLKVVHTATPDWPSASGFAGSDDPLTVMKYWSGTGPDLICVRHGHRGSYVWDKFHDEFWHVPSVPVNVVDPTGGGNSYGGGMSVGWDKTQDARSAGCYGTISASMIIREVGVPTMSQRLQEEAIKMLPEVIGCCKKM